MSLIGENLGYSASGHRLLNGVSITIQPGQVHAVIGPNGAGKSTLLKLLAGDLSPRHGQVLLNEKSLHSWSARERANLRAVLPQSETLRFGFSAEEVVRLGRLSSGPTDDVQENEIVHLALEEADAAHLAKRKYPSLSGGERSRVQFARVLAQIWNTTPLGPRFLLLDEPTANLDLAHQHTCMSVARRFSAQNIGVLAVVHDPNLAMLYADQVTLLCCGEVMASGSPSTVLTAENLGRVYGVKVEMLQSSSSDRSYIAVMT